jgi:hypothetical protein
MVSEGAAYYRLFVSASNVKTPSRTNRAGGLTGAFLFITTRRRKPGPGCAPGQASAAASSTGFQPDVRRHRYAEIVADNDA